MMARIIGWSAIVATWAFALWTAWSTGSVLGLIALCVCFMVWRLVRPVRR